MSDSYPLNFGVPLGSLLGPVLFNCLMSFLLPILKSIGSLVFIGYVNLILYVPILVTFATQCILLPLIILGVKYRLSRTVAQNVWQALVDLTRRKSHWKPYTGFQWKRELNLKILLFTYKILHHVPNTPMHFQDQFYIQDIVSVTRSRFKNLLFCQHSSLLSTVGDGLLYMAVVEIWNSLPTDLQSSSSLSCFKSALKTHIFRLYFK